MLTWGGCESGVADSTVVMLLFPEELLEESMMISIVAVPIYTPTRCVKGSRFQAFLPEFIDVYSVIAILTGVRWDLSVVVIYTSLIANELEHTFLLIDYW